VRLKLERDYRVGLGDSIFGRFTCGDLDLLSCERSWRNNEPGKSCVPAGFYYLEPHNGTKYQGTFALIGADVSHSKEIGVARYACVLHWAKAGMYLEGCVSVGHQLIVTPGTAWLDEPAINEVLAVLAARPAGEKHYLEITEAFPISIAA
jgi:hypothetical protein